MDQPSQPGPIGYGGYIGGNQLIRKTITIPYTFNSFEVGDKVQTKIPLFGFDPYTVYVVREVIDPVLPGELGSIRLDGTHGRIGAKFFKLASQEAIEYSDDVN